MSLRVESDSTPPPPRALNLTKPNVALPMAMLGGLIVSGYIVGIYAEKIPSEEKVQRIAAMASEAAVGAAIAADSPRRLAVQHQIDELAKSHSDLAQSMSRLSTSVTRLEVYNEIHAMSAVRPSVSSPKAILMRRNIIAGRDPLAGIVPSEDRQ